MTDFITFYLELVIIFLFPFAQALNLVLFVNDTTSNSALNLLTENHVFSSYDYYSATSLEGIVILLNELDSPKILIDLTENVAYHYYLSHLCGDLKTVHLVIDDSLNYFTDWTFSGSSSRPGYLNALNVLFSHFNWTQGIIFNSNENTFIVDYLMDFSEYFKSVTIEPNSNINDIIGRIAMPLGATLYYVFSDAEDTAFIQQTLITKKLTKLGSGIVLGKESYYKTVIDGSLLITEENQEYTDSKEAYISNAVLYILAALEEYIDNDFQIKNTMEKICPYNFCGNSFSLVNYFDGSRTIVGKLTSSSISITQKIIFTGNTTTPPVSEKKTLPISINAGTTNYGKASFATLPIYARGTSMAIKMINEGLGILENFQMSLFVYDCGSTFYDPTYGYSCFLKDIDKFGLGAVSSYTSGVTMATLNTFKLLNLTVPVVGSATSSSALNSTSVYPWFSRVQVSDSNLASQMPNLLKALGWKSFAILYQNETWGISSYLALKEVADNAGLTIVNPNEYRAIPPGLTRDNIGNYSYVLQGILDSNARLVVEFMYDDLLGYTLEKFYDLGARNGDLIFFSAISAALIDIGAKDDAYRHKRLAIGCPMLVFQSPVWMGALGKSIYNNLKNDYQTTPSDLSCNFFDSAFLIANALDFMINRGQDYTDGYKLNYTIRNIKISGCSGTLAISQGSNDREMDSMSIDSNQVINNSLVVYHIGLYTPSNTRYLTFENPFFYDNQYTIIKPPDLRNQNGNCPFPDSKIRTFYDGRYLVFGICFSIAFVTSIITFYIWKKWWNVEIGELKERKEISSQDFIVGATIAVEFFQFASMGPDYRSFNSFLSSIGEALSLDLGNFVKLSNGVFWGICDAILGLSVTWVVLCITVFYRLDEKYSHVSIFRFLGQLADLLMPILGNLCFIPFVSVLLDVFVCDESIGNHFTDSFLSKDCYQFCWKGDHVIYAILSGIAILTYEPLAVFCRPLWQEFQSVLHVKTLPLFLMAKTIIQITLIVMNKTVKRAEAATHGFLFLLVLLIYVIFIFKNKPYNYPRFSWWQGVSIIGVMWLGFLTTIDILTNNSNFPWIALVICGWAIIISVGVYVQRKKYPSLLFRKKGKDTSTLFRFAFQFGNRSRVSADEFNRMRRSSKIAPSSSNNNK
ncbi:unnamed protein product [Blepharisma stoltei]|uniref:Receptor ligand binding region domain-containing protein n=1 Tax=Blepharisma stoltei TaxID=1481888 RepID=A0AAU9IL60_9CILI|nr:unnamed protein product [Blepharisma stoltei]